MKKGRINTVITFEDDNIDYDTQLIYLRESSETSVMVKVIGSLSHGTSVNILEQKGDYVHVEEITDNETPAKGWCHKDFVINE